MMRLSMQCPNTGSPTIRFPLSPPPSPSPTLATFPVQGLPPRSIPLLWKGTTMKAPNSLRKSLGPSHLSSVTRTFDATQKGAESGSNQLRLLQPGKVDKPLQNLPVGISQSDRSFLSQSQIIRSEEHTSELQS